MAPVWEEGRLGGGIEEDEEEEEKRASGMLGCECRGRKKEPIGMLEMGDMAAGARRNCPKVRLCWKRVGVVRRSILGGGCVGGRQKKTVRSAQQTDDLPCSCTPYAYTALAQGLENR
jgi:hypothetical protein